MISQAYSALESGAQSVGHAVRWTAHTGLSAAAGTANLLGKGILFTGTIAGAALAYDTYCWHNKTSLPVWSKTAVGDTSLPLGVTVLNTLDRPKCFDHPEYADCRFDANQVIAAQAICTGIVIAATPALWHICRKVEAAINYIDRSITPTR